MRKLFLASAVSAIFSLPVGVSAQTAPAVAPASPHTVTENVGLVSQYVFRGLTQTRGQPALQGGLDYSHASGFYAGTWLSNISWFTDQNANTKTAPISLASPGATGAPYSPFNSNSASLEWDFYGGYKNSFGGGDWNYDVGAIQYYYPGTYDNWGASGGNNSYFSYTDYKLGVTKDYLGATFGLAWTHANTKDAAPDGLTTAYLNAFGKNIGGNRIALSA